MLFRHLHLFISENHLFYSVVYALAYLKTQQNPPDFNSTVYSIGQDKFLKLKEIEEYVMLDYTQFVFFDRCMKLNDVLAEHFGVFLRFYERRNKFRYQLRQKLKTKNEIKIELSACVIQKFNGYDLLRTKLKKDEKKSLAPLDIVYEPTHLLFFCTKNLACISDLLRHNSQEH